jgi:hypothetical protein
MAASFGLAPGKNKTIMLTEIALYNATVGDNWSDNSGWKTPPLPSDGFAMPGTENNWYGIARTVEN